MTGCAASEDPSEDLESSSEAVTLQAENLGNIRSGDVKTGSYSGGAPWRTYTFTAKGGDTVTGDIQISGGDAVGAMTDGSLNVAAEDDNNGPGNDARVIYRIPAGPARTFKVAFKDKSATSGNFKVKFDLCNRADEPWRDYRYPADKCIDVTFTCTAPDRAFANSCGCGCESPH